jgi:hypothetical protein
MFPQIVLVDILSLQGGLFPNILAPADFSGGLKV